MSDEPIFPLDSSAAQFLECLLVLDEYVAEQADQAEAWEVAQEEIDHLQTDPTWTASWQIVELGHQMLAEYFALVQTIELTEQKVRDEVGKLLLPLERGQ